MKSTKIALLISGGLDSSILLWRLLRQKHIVYPVYFQSGHVWEVAELYWLKQFLKTLAAPNLKPLKILSSATNDLYEKHWSITGKKIPGAKSSDLKVYLPGKNLLLITKAAVYCSIHKIPALALAPLKTNPFPDAEPSFFRLLEQVCSKGLNFRLKIQTPFLTFAKREVMKSGLSAPLYFSFSCLAPKRKYLHCGHCNKCTERKKAFRDIGIIDLTVYAH